MADAIVDGNMRLAPQLWLEVNKRIEIIRGQFDPRRPTGTRRFFESVPTGAHRFLFLFGRHACGQLNIRRWEIFAAEIANGQVRAADERHGENNQKDNEDETALCEAAHPSLLRRRFDHAVWLMRLSPSRSLPARRSVCHRDCAVPPKACEFQQESA